MILSSYEQWLAIEYQKGSISVPIPSPSTLRMAKSLRLRRSTCLCSQQMLEYMVFFMTLDQWRQVPFSLRQQSAYQGVGLKRDLKVITTKSAPVRWFQRQRHFKSQQFQVTSVTLAKDLSLMLQRAWLTCSVKAEKHKRGRIKICLILQSILKHHSSPSSIHATLLQVILPTFAPIQDYKNQRSRSPQKSIRFENRLENNIPDYREGRISQMATKF